MVGEGRVQRKPKRDRYAPGTVVEGNDIRWGRDGEIRQMVDILSAVLTDGLPAVEAACVDQAKRMLAEHPDLPRGRIEQVVELTRGARSVVRLGSEE